MAKTVFEVDRELNITGRGSLINEMKGLEQLALGPCIQIAMSSFKEINELYLKAISNDGRIIGSERSDLIDSIDSFFDTLILAWMSLNPRNTENSILIENKKHNFRLLIEEKNKIWNVTGRITGIMITPVKNFREIYGSKLAPQIIELLQTYREAVADRVIDDTEKDALMKGIRQVLYYTLFLRLQLERCLIND